MPADFDEPGSQGGVFAMEDVEHPPAGLVLEPGFVMSALEASDPHHGTSAPFLERMIRGGTAMFYNDLFELELHELAFARAVREIRLGPTRTGLTYTAPAVHRLARGLLGRWSAVKGRGETVHVEPPEMLADVLYFMERFGLSAAHSVQASLTVASGADGIATVEQRFSAVDETLLPVFVPRGIASRARGRRPDAKWSG